MQTILFKNKKSLLKLLLILTIISYTLFYSPQKNLISGDTSYNNDELSDVYFPNTSDGEITIITPENKTHTEPDSGYYPGSFGFEDSIPGTIPDGWYTRSSGDGYYEIDHLLEDHYNVYEIRKSGGTSKVETYKILPQSATIGTIEFWLYKDTDSSVDPTRITLRDEPTGGYIPFGIENEDLFIGAWSEKIYTFNNVFSKNEWHHIRVDFDLNVGWQLKLDNTLYGAGHAFTVYASDHPPPSKINTFHVESIYSGDNPSYGAWFDAISYSWDSNYNSGDNLNEGLLLSYDNSTNLDWQGYLLDGQTNKTILGNTTVNMPNDGSHTIQVFGIDSLGTIFSSDIRYFSVDILSPIITINSPLQNEHYDSLAPNFDVSITEPNLNTTWYTIDNGLTNITFTGFTGTIDQTEWGDHLDGPIIIRFYANDTFGRINYVDVLVEKDTLNPEITINTPLTGEIFTELPPHFDLIIDEVNLDTTWYTLDGGATTIAFSELTGYIDSTAWNNASIGAVSIRFYARDKAGNEVYQEVIVIKSSSQQEPPPGIPGFNISLLCLTIVIITASLLKIKKYKIK
jgi:hypothetical protein